MTDLTAKNRKRAERERNRAAGLVRVEVWARPAYVQAIREFAAALRKKTRSSRA